MLSLITMIDVAPAPPVSVWEPSIWQGAVVHTTLPLAETFTDPQRGDFVKFDGEGKLIRSPSGGAGAYLDDYQGLIVSTVPNSAEHPAFSAPYNRPIVALLSPNKTELLMREMNFWGEYVSPTLRPNDPTIFVFDPFTRLWGVQYAQNYHIPTGRVVKVLSDGRLLILFGEP
jgi:hypothetical protein